MRRVVGIPLRISLGIATMAVGLVAIATPAVADEGSWYENTYCLAPAACFWRGAINATPELSSPSRDSDFSNDYYLEGYGLNDGVKVYGNSFATIKVQAFINKNYNDPTYCIVQGQYAGPYPIQQSAGISSFKSC